MLPTATPSSDTLHSASVAPANTDQASPVLATSAIRASCVLSPSSATKISAKLLSTTPRPPWRSAASSSGSPASRHDFQAKNRNSTPAATSTAARGT